MRKKHRQKILSIRLLLIQKDITIYEIDFEDLFPKSLTHLGILPSFDTKIRKGTC
jgi:hypothetical protein